MEDVERKSEEATCARLFPDRGDAGPVHAGPDWARVHRELAKTGVTLKLLHAEYADGRAEAGAPVDVLRQVPQALPAVHGVALRGEPRRAQGGQEHGGRLVGAHDAARGPRDRRGQEGVPVRGLPPVQPVQLRRADARHEAGYMAAVPRARLLLPGRRDALHRPRQPEDRRHRPPQGRGAGPERGLRGARRALRLGRDPGEGQAAPATSRAPRTRYGRPRPT